MSIDSHSVAFPFEFEAEPPSLADLDLRARGHARDADRAMLAAYRLYDAIEGGSSGPPDQARLDVLYAEARRERSLERRSLAGLNIAFRSAGAVTGDFRDAGKSTYRVGPDGGMATRLGAILPVDEDPGYSDRDDLAERAFEYGQMIHLDGR